MLPFLAAATFLDDLLSPYSLQLPWALALLPVLLLLAVIAWRRRLPSLLLPTLQPSLRADHGRSAAGSAILRLPILLEALAISLLVIAVARPQLRNESRFQRVQGIDIILALDISQSMSLLDIPTPDGLTNTQIRNHAISAVNEGHARPRVDIAKEELDRFIHGRPTDQLGLVAFGSYAYVACPPTLDHDFLRGRVSQLDAGMFRLASQTNIAAPVATAVNRLKDSPAKRRVIVLFTDGQHNIDAYITPRDAAHLAAQYHIVLHTVGIGSDYAWELRRSLRHASLVPWTGASYDRQLLEDMAHETGGQFFEAQDAAGFRQVMDQISQLETVQIDQRVQVSYRELYPPWLWSGIGLLLLAFLLEHTLLLRVP